MIVLNLFADTTGGLSGFLKRLIFLVELLAYLVTFVESSATVHLQKGLLDQIFELNNTLLQRLNTDFGMKQFCRKQLWIFCRTVALLLTTIVGTSFFFATEAVDVMMLFLIPTMIAQSRLMQVAVFVECLTEMLNRLVLVVQREQTNERVGLVVGGNDAMIKECMECYSKLWKFAGAISTTFGWSLLPIFALKICEWIHTCYLSMFNTYVVKSPLFHACKF